jgi:CHAD domain-containing protein
MLEYDYIHYNLEIHMDNCIRNIKRVYSKLEKYLENPSEENIHHMRTSLRRLEATYQSSPKKIRNKKKMKAFSDTGKQLFKINSEIRDVDIILQILATDGKITEEQLESFEHSLTQEREHRLVEAREIALELQDITVPDIYDKDKIRKN